MDIAYSGGNKYSGETMVGCSERQPTITERLERTKADLESRLKEVNEALDGLKKNPEVTKVFDLVSKVRSY